MLPGDTPIQKFNRKYQLGGEFYEDIVEESEDPKFEGRLQDYASSFAGNIEGKDPFGKNVVSAFGDYPAMATRIFNELTEKAKQKAAEGKELAPYDKDRLEYYGHVSGLTGKTNVPETPIMIDDPKTSGQLLDEIMEEQKAKKELARLTGDWGDLETVTEIPDAGTVQLEDVIETDIQSITGGIDKTVPQDVLNEIAAEEAARAEAAARDRENARVAEAKAIADAAAEKERQYAAAQERMNRRGDRDVPSPPTNVGNPFGYYAGGRVRYSKGGIVSLLK